MLTLFNNITEEKHLTPHKVLRAEGWKKTGEHNGNHVYTHEHHTGHEIHLNPKNGGFEHKVVFNASHHAKQIHITHQNALAHHLNAHSRTADYDAYNREHKKGSAKGMDRGREGYDSAPGPRGARG